MTSSSAASWLRSGLPALGIVAIAAIALIQLPAHEDPSEQATRLLLEGTMAVRQAYWASERAPMTGGLEVVAAGQALRALRELAVTHNTKQSWRMLALAQYILGVEGWRESLARLADAKPRHTLAEVDRERAMWRVVLEPDQAMSGRPVTETGARPMSAGASSQTRERQRQMAAGRRFLDSLDLGWFRHPARAALCENHGFNAEARRHREYALRASDHLTIAVVLAILAGLAGMGLWFTLALARLAMGRDALARYVARFPAVSHEHSRALALAGAAYFAGLAGLKMLGPLLPRSAVAFLLDGRGDTTRLVLNALIGLASLLPPLIVLRVAGLRGRKRSAILGLTQPRLLRDPLAAIAGYIAALPALALTLIVSTALFDPSGSPVNPAIEEFVAGDSAMVKALMLLMGVVIAPFVEEVVFRGILLRSLQPHVGVGWAIVLSSAVFAILHPQLPMGFLSIFCLGAAFAVVYRVTGSIWPSVLMHAINNATVFAYLALALAD